MPLKYQSEEILHPFLFFSKKIRWEKTIEKENENERTDLWVWRFYALRTGQIYAWKLRQLCASVHNTHKYSRI
jgi:hypothetical protein